MKMLILMQPPVLKKPKCNLLHTAKIYSLHMFFTYIWRALLTVCLCLNVRLHTYCD